MTFLRLPDGTVAHVRLSQGRSVRCKVCNHLTAQRFLRECDWPMPPDGAKTCDLLMCQHCAEPVGPDKHLCPEHFIAFKRNPS